MSRSFTLTLNGNEPITNISYFPPIELTNGEYECALIDFYITTTKEPIYFNRNNSIGQLLGFNKKIIYPGLKKTYISDQPVNILRRNTIRWVCNIVSGSYIDSRQDHSLYEFGINVLSDYKMNITPHNLI